MTDDDMFEHMDTILGEKEGMQGSSLNQTNESQRYELGTDSKPSSFWAYQLELWGVKDE